MSFTTTTNSNLEENDRHLRIRIIRPLAELEREAILKAVECCGPEQAAKALGIGTSTLYRRLFLYRASVLGPPSSESKLAIVIPLENLRVLLHEADRAAKTLFLCKDETGPLVAQRLSKLIEEFTHKLPQLNTWKK